MKPVYFPFTHIETPIGAALARCFEKTLIYKPLLTSPEGNPENIEARFPVQGDEERLSSHFESYLAWAQLHGGGLSHFKGRAGEIPLYDENALTRIRSEIKGMNRKKTPAPAPDPLFTARIFLLMAERFDRQQEELAAGLSNLDGMQQQLMRALKSDDFEEKDEEKILWGEDPGIHATQSRVEAWAQLARKDADVPPFWITRSRAAFDQVIDELPEWKSKAEIARIPSVETPDLAEWRRNELDEFLKACLYGGSEGALPAAPKSAGPMDLHLRLHQIPITPMDALLHLSGVQRLEPASSKGNLLIGLLEPSF